MTNKVFYTVASMLLLLLAGVAVASPVLAGGCPMGTRYDCTQMPNGKMSCGCR